MDTEELKAQRLKTDCNVFIDRAIEMLKDFYKDEFLTAGYNGVVSLLQYAKESHAAATPEKEDKSNVEELKRRLAKEGSVSELDTQDAYAVEWTVAAMKKEEEQAEWEFLQIIKANHDITKNSDGSEWEGYSAKKAVLETYDDLFEIIKGLPLKRPTPVNKRNEGKEVFKKIKMIALCAFNSSTQIEGSAGFETWWENELVYNDWLRERPDKSNEAGERKFTLDEALEIANEFYRRGLVGGAGNGNEYFKEKFGIDLGERK